MLSPIQKDEWEWKKENRNAFFALMVLTIALVGGGAWANGWIIPGQISVIASATLGFLDWVYKDSIENQATRTAKFDSDASQLLVLYGEFTATTSPSFLVSYRVAYALSTFARNLAAHSYYPRHFKRIEFFTEDALSRLQNRSVKYSPEEEVLLSTCLT